MPRRRFPLTRWLFAAAIVSTLVSASRAGEPSTSTLPYAQQEDVIYGLTDGVALVMDIFRPTGTANGRAIVDIASGGWNSDRGRINDHKQAQMYDIMCGRGYTVFAVRPGSVTKFTALEMVDHVERAIRWVKSRASEYGIDPNKLGLCGASAGGHLTCLTAASADDGDPMAKDPLGQASSRVHALVAFFPPTDFLAWGKADFDPAKSTARLGGILGPLMFTGGLKGQTDDEIRAQAEKISPARLVTSQMPPLLLIHGDADFVVPLQQSQVMLEAMQKAGVPCELIVKPGGGHPWPTIHEEVKIAADWLDKHLLN